MTILSDCGSCGATGLYRGMCEAKGEAVVCLDCKGTGARPIKYKPYGGRRRVRGVTTIRQSAGKFLVGPIGGYGKPMTYEQFLRAYPEPSKALAKRAGEQ